MTTTITVDTADLLSLLRDVREAASGAAVLPFLNGVMLYTVTVDGKHRLVGTATDRFCALQGSIPVTGEAPGRFFLSCDQIGQVTTSLRPYASRKRAGTAQTEVTVTDTEVRFAQVSLDQLAAVTITVPRNQADNFPNLAKLFREAQARKGSDKPFHVNGALLALLARLSARHGTVMSLHPHGEGGAVVVRVGEDLLGILMPVRVGADRTAPMDVPVHDIPVLLEPQPQEQAA